MEKQTQAVNQWELIPDSKSSPWRGCTTVARNIRLCKCPPKAVGDKADERNGEYGACKIAHQMWWLNRTSNSGQDRESLAALRAASAFGGKTRVWVFFFPHCFLKQDEYNHFLALAPLCYRQSVSTHFQIQFKKETK